MFPNDLQRGAMKTDTVETLFKSLTYGVHTFTFTKRDMSYPTFSFGRICGPKFQNLCLFVTGYLQIGTYLNIHFFQLEVLGFQTFQSELSVL